MRSRAAGRVEVQDDISVRVEPTPIADVAVVVVDCDRVVELRPADALQVDREGLSLLHHYSRHSAPDDALPDVEGHLGEHLATLYQLNDVPAAEAVWNLDRRLERSAGGLRAAERLRDEDPAGAGAVHAVADDGGPDQLDAPAVRYPRRAQRHFGVHWPSGGCELGLHAASGLEPARYERRSGADRRSNPDRPVDRRR